MLSEIQQTATALRNGGVILYPTDTIWGIGCDARKAEAVERVFVLKGRDSAKSLVLLMKDEAAVRGLIPGAPEAAFRLMAESDRPLTVIFPGAAGLAPHVAAADGSVAIRIPKDGFLQHLLAEVNIPLVSTSANLSGEPFPRSFADVPRSIADGVDYAVNLRRDEIATGPPSRIIRILPDGTAEIIRP